MGSFLYDLKGQATVMNGIVFLFILSYLLYRYGKRRMAIGMSVFSMLIFLLCSTSYLPQYVVGKMEATYAPLQLPIPQMDSSTVLIHVLGSGYALDERVPATSQLGSIGMSRLAEAIRIHRSLPNSIIVCSGYSAFGLETQAQVTRKAAILLGVDSNQLTTLNEPSTTLEEANELRKRYDSATRVIVVTDALHMPRAMRFFKAEGFDPIAAPTNYKVNKGPNQYGMKYWPSFENIGLMNYLLHEWLGRLRARGKRF